MPTVTESALAVIRNRTITIYASGSTAGEDHALLESRKKIFATLLNRLAELHINRPPPESFYIGEPYIEDEHKVACIISANFVFPAYIEPVDFWLYGARVMAVQHGHILHVQIHKRISQQLWDDVRLQIPFKEKFLIGYLASYMPAINRRLIDNRHYEGHLLSRTFAMFEAVRVSVSVQGRHLPLSWPISFLPFPPSAALANNVRATYVYEFVDSINAYFTSDFDDCIRRLVTSAENLFEVRGWKTRTSPKTLFRKILRLLGFKSKTSNSFRRILTEYVNDGSLAGEVVTENMEFIYTIRNKIVHAGFRMSTTSGQFCDKAIATLKYMIARHCQDMIISRYVDTLYMQFRMQCSELGEMYNLGVIEKRRKDDGNSETPVIDSAAAFNSFMFQALRFTELDKLSI
ncbi:hypothetical protein DES32_2291 [Methylovirgula ligni]|uniref:Uncharacterized protein n=2 Tax=Methylovirgula ligni TaxID=569860 RepID=A0A3D9YZD4_9HYPH|nr:hypothetical protein DES32_2291 [Methylovirgula ligni]